jgi:murein DD-endopeptidase MepM/ murein hydrolase activator NlpD
LEGVTISGRLLQNVLIGAILFVASRSASAECKDEWICVDAVEQGGNIELSAENLRDYPITYTLTVRTHDLIVEGPRTVTRTLGPNQTALVMALRNKNKSIDGKYRYSFEWTVGDKNATHNDDYLYALPYSSGHSYRIIQGFRSRFSHTGLEEFAIDFDMPVGTPVHAARAGVVARVEESHSKGCWEDGCGKHANFIIVLHSDGTTGEYYHMQKDGALVNVGDRVAQGQAIGYSGNTGHTTMPHLHFAVYRATDWGNTQSIPVRFQGADGIIDRPRRGARYQAL